MPSTTHTPSIAYWNEVSVSRWLNKNRPDIYFSPDGFIPLRCRVRCVPVVHDLAPIVYPQYMRWRDYIYYRIFQLKMIKRAWMVFTVSEFSKTEILRCSAISSDKVHVAYNGIHSGFNPKRKVAIDLNVLDIKRPYFMYLGSIHPRKNVFGLIKSFEYYRAAGGQASLVISGRKAWKSTDVDDLLQKSPVASHIVWLPYLPSSELQAVLKNALALVYISHYEGFGLPVLEAMAMGVPVVTSANSSMSEIGGNAVITHDPLNHEAISKAMLALTNDEDLRQQLIEKGKSQAIKFDYNESAQKILKIMKTKFYETK